MPNKETTEAVVERTNVTKDKELGRLKNLHFSDILKFGQHLQTGQQETVLESSANVSENLTNQPVQ